MNNKPNIAVFSQTLDRGGAEKQSVLLAKVLSKQYSIHFIVFYNNRIDKKFVKLLAENNIPIITFSGGRISKFLAIRRYLLKNNISILFNFLLLPTLLGGLVTFTTNIKSIGGIRNSLLKGRKEFFNKICHNYLSVFTIFNNYVGYRKYIARGYKINKAIVIPNAICFEQPVVVRENSSKICILSVGRFVKAKDYFTALKAVAELKKNTQSFNYLILGWGELLPVIEDEINKLNLRDTVKIITEQPPSLDKYYKEADIFFQPSLYEGVSNTLLEASSWSLPIVTTPVGDTPRIVENEKNGYLCQPGDFMLMAKKLELLCINRNLRIDFGKYGYQKVKNEYGINIFETKYTELIKKIS